jgi:2-hydroxy-3-oxopropionate reductase
VAEALTFAAKAGADPAKVRAALLGGAAASPILENHGARMLARDFAPGFRAELQQKDLNVALSAARELGVVLPATAAAEQIYNGVRARGAEKDDHIAVLKVLEDLAGGAGGP